VGRIGRAHHAQRPRVVEQAQQQRALGGFVQLGVVALDARDGQQFGHHFFVLVGALAQVDRGQVEAENLDRADQRAQALGDQAAPWWASSELRWCAGRPGSPPDLR
jgi:hypothetical protein